LADGDYTIGVRPHHMSLHQPQGKSMKLDCTVSTTEITGSESFIHLQSKGIHMVALMHGVHRVEIGDDDSRLSRPGPSVCLRSQQNLVFRTGF
jgi:glycerol transport system ATP-binding protein